MAYRSPFSNGPQIRRAPLAPLQRRVGALRNPFVLPKPSVEPPVPKRPFIDTGENPEAQGAFGGEATPSKPFRFPVTNEFDTPANFGVFDPLKAARIERGLRAENTFGIGPTPLLPGSTLPERRVGGVFTSEPLIAATFRGWKTPDGDTVTDAQIDAAAVAGGTTRDEVIAKYGLTQGDIPNPAFKTAEAGLSEPERDFRKFGGAVPASLGGGTEKPEKSPKTIKDIITRKMSDGKTYRIAVYGDDSEQNLGEVEDVDTRQQERTVHSPDNPDIQRREFSYRDENGKLVTKYGAWEWTPSALARKLKEQEIEGRVGAQTGAINAINASATGKPVGAAYTYTPDNQQGYASLTKPAFAAPAPGEGGDYGTLRGTDPRNQQAVAQNEAFARQETTRLRAIGDSSQAATQILQDFKSGALATKPPAVRQAVLQALRSYHGQRDAEGQPLDFSEAIKALEQSLQPQSRRPFVTVAAGSV